MTSTRSPKPSQPVTVVVGGMHGSGGNVARRFHDVGHRVIIVDRRASPDGDAEPYYEAVVAADLSQLSGVEDGAARLADMVEALDNLIFSLRYRGAEDEAWEGEIALDVTATRVLIDRLHTRMTPEGASIVMTSSTAAAHYTPGCSIAYHTAKAAVEQMMRCYAYELGPLGIRVNAVAPGYIVKDESRSYFEADQDNVREVAQMHPLGRYGTADDVADVVSFLCSRQSSFVTGQVITVDGGLSLRNPGF